jgi:hypothetical protein
MLGNKGDTLMVQNLAAIERIVRIFLGLSIISAAAITTAGALMWLGILIGIVLTFSGAIGFCPAYGMFGFRTNE